MLAVGAVFAHNDRFTQNNESVAAEILFEDSSSTMAGTVSIDGQLELPSAPVLPALEGIGRKQLLPRARNNKSPPAWRCVMSRTLIAILLFGLAVGPMTVSVSSVEARIAQLSAEAQTALDLRVTTFLASRRGTWQDLNVPDADGRAVHDLIVKHQLTRALEIGTSTGHSGIWIAWALSKTGGKLITIDIDERRHREALSNFEEAGVAAFIDARLGDAHELVPALEGPFDFVFIDADKDWYVNYAKAVLPRLTPNGVLTAHNVSGSGGRGRRGGQGADYYAYVRALPDYDTTIVNGQLAVSVRHVR